MMYDILKQLFTGDVSAKELSGPVGIVYAVNESAKAGVIYVVYLAALLSLNLAVMNMLPFPALDGGDCFFLRSGRSPESVLPMRWKAGYIL